MREHLLVCILMLSVLSALLAEHIPANQPASPSIRAPGAVNDGLKRAQADSEQGLVWTPRRSEGNATGYSEETNFSETTSKRRFAQISLPGTSKS